MTDIQVNERRTRIMPALAASLTDVVLRRRFDEDEEYEDGFTFEDEEDDDEKDGDELDGDEEDGAGDADDVEEEFDDNIELGEDPEER